MTRTKTLFAAVLFVALGYAVPVLLFTSLHYRQAESQGKIMSSAAILAAADMTQLGR